METLIGFFSEKGVNGEHKYGKSIIKGVTTTMMPTDTITINDLINTLQTKHKNMFISISNQKESSNPIEINNYNELQKYFCHKIIGILCTETKEGKIYYDVFIDYRTRQSDRNNYQIHKWISPFGEGQTDYDVLSIYINQNELYNNFDCENTGETNTILVDDKEESGRLYNLTPKKDKAITIENFIKLINIKSDIPSYISIEVCDSGKTTNFQKINGEKIDPNLNKYKIISGAITTGENGVYYAVLVESPTKEVGKQG